ncbi:unnamed protein product [Coffea canephora]|uniref:Uncharacterized protein n=1 Tax=Coffea canephora TaxID=49390 RepID=A0A068URU7_COFCA|nr:unnamed protein product [Coffea canephora]
MASTCSIDRVLLGLESIVNNLPYRAWAYGAHAAIKDMKFLKTFLMCARKWSLVHLYLQSDNVVKKVSLPSFLSCIEDTFHEYEEDIHSLSLRSEILTDKYDWDVHYSIVDHGVFREIGIQIISLKQEIIQIYFALASSRSFQSNSCMTDDELLEFIDRILQNLADLDLKNDYKNLKLNKTRIYAALSAQVQDLEAKLTFLKSFIPFAKMRGTADIPALLLAHFEVVALTAARLSYMWSFWNDDVEAKRNPEFDDRNACSFKLLSIRAVDFHVYEIYKEVLAASNSSASLHTAVMDERILNNFNDSLIGRLWELLCCSSSFVDSMKDEMQILYAGLRFLRSILREHHEMMDEQNEKIGALLGEAGIIIFAPTLSRVIEGEVSFSGSTQVLDFHHMLANINIHIKHFQDQISGSSTIESLPNSSHSLRAPEVSQTSSRMLSKGKMPIAREIMVGLDDEAAKVIRRLRWGSEQVEIVPIVGMAGLGKTTLAKKVYNDSSVTCYFHIRLWCTVSQEFNMKNVLLQILCSDGKHSRKDEFQNLDEHALLEKLRQRLLKNRYLLVFDDVWDIEVWNELGTAFPNDKNGSRIIFTSRFSNVASEVQYGGEHHNIRCLTVEESFELLQKKVFGEEEECPQALHELGMREDFIKSRLFCPHLASLLFFDATPGYKKLKLFNISFLFSIYKHLNVLHFEGNNLRLKELPAEVESLLCLRYLALTAWHMKFIPPSIAKLSHLETFCLYSKSVVSLPDSIWNMKKLRHVHLAQVIFIPFSSNDNGVENLSTLPNLDTLSYLCLNAEGENLLRRIPNVRQLKISKCETGVLNMSRLECLESLTWWGNYSSGSREHVELSFPMNLKKLSLYNLGLPCSKMSLVEKLPNLEVLKLQYQSMDGQRWELMEGGFPKLRVLTLGCGEIVEWTETDPDSDDYFPCLQQLKLDGISELKMMPACLGSIYTLETIEMKDCKDGVKSLVREIEEAQKYNGNENLKITIYEDY